MVRWSKPSVKRWMLRMAMESLPSLSVMTSASLLRPPMPRIAALRLRDDRRAELLAEDAGVGEGEGAAGDIVWSELLVAGAVGEVDDGARDAEEGLVLGLLDDGDDQAPLQRDRDADVDVPVVEDGVALRRELTMGCLRSAWTAARVMNGM